MTRLVFALLLALQCSATLANECVFTQGELTSRPLPDEGPTKVGMRVYVNDIIKIDDAEQAFTADVFFSALWRDPRLAHPGENSCTTSSTQVWTPGLRLLNRRHIERDQGESLDVSPDGDVTMSVRGYGDFSFRADLTEFPFDKQTLRFTLVAGLGAGELNFAIDPNLLGTADSFSVANWQITLLGARAGTQYVAPADRDLPRLDIILQAERLTGYYSWQQLLPLCLVVMMTWVVFWIPLEYVPPRVGLAATAMLTLIAYRFAMSSVLPPIAYLTRLDVFMIGASILVFVALAAAVAVTWISHSRSEALAEALNAHCRWLSPLVLIALTAFAFG